MRVVLLNGPKRAGKNTAARALSDVFGADVIGFSHHLKRFTHAIYGLPASTDPDHFDAVKDICSPVFWGLSPRQAYIHYSENVIKPLHGKNFFGDMALRSMEMARSELIAVPDSGFREEAERVVAKVGAENVLLLRIYREGSNFQGDSRGYISLDDLGVMREDIYNPESVHAFQRSIIRIVGNWSAGATHVAA